MAMRAAEKDYWGFGKKIEIKKLQNKCQSKD
jgi:hypothetical protein